MPQSAGSNTESGRRVYVHENLLRSSSPFFDRELGSRPVNETCCEVELDRAYAIHLESFVRWLYFRKLPAAITETQDPEYLAKAYCQIHERTHIDLTDAVMDQLIRCVQADSTKVGRADPTIYERLLWPYDRSPWPSADKWMSKKLLVDLAIHWCRPPNSGLDPNKPTARLKKATFGAMVDELRRLERGEPATNPFTADRCTYHEHTAKGLSCYKTKM